jgi:hypothetical protein
VRQSSIRKYLSRTILVTPDPRKKFFFQVFFFFAEIFIGPSTLSLDVEISIDCKTIHCAESLTYIHTMSFFFFHSREKNVSEQKWKLFLEFCLRPWQMKITTWRPKCCRCWRLFIPEEVKLHQGDQTNLWKNRLKCSPNHFLLKRIPTQILQWKKSPQNLEYFCNFSETDQSKQLSLFTQSGHPEQHQAEWTQTFKTSNHY